MSDVPTATELGKVLGLIVHDLRNPAATVAANVAFVKDVVPMGEDEDLREALEDMDVALADLLQGLDQVAWISRWLGGHSAVATAEGDAAATVRGLSLLPSLGELEILVEGTDLRVRGGGEALGNLLGVLLSNSVQHAPDSRISVAAQRLGPQVVIEVRDGGRALAPELREGAFSLSAQDSLKKRVDGRYGRVVGLFAAKVLADSMGATLEAGGEDGAAFFRVTLQSAD